MHPLGCGVLWASPPSDQEDCGREVRGWWSVEGQRRFSSCFMSFVFSISVVVDVLSVRLHLPFDPWRSSPPAGDDLVAATGDLVHPDGVEDVKGDAGGDPGYLSAQPQAGVLGGAKGGHDAGPVRWHDGDAHQEEDRRHGHAVHHHQAVRAGILEYLQEPPDQRG